MSNDKSAEEIVRRIDAIKARCEAATPKTPDPCKHCGARCLNTPVRGPRLVEQGYTCNALRRTKYYVRCLECGIMTCTYDTPGEALAVWDRTPEEGRE